MPDIQVEHLTLGQYTCSQNYLFSMDAQQQRHCFVILEVLKHQQQGSCQSSLPTDKYAGRKSFSQIGDRSCLGVDPKHGRYKGLPKTHSDTI